MLAAVVVDDPATPGLDLGDSITLANGATIPTSSDLATRLREAGFTRVQNLEGSIFQWANEHRTLVRNDQPVSRVHPYSKLWGRLLTDDVRAPIKQ